MIVIYLLELKIKEYLKEYDIYCYINMLISISIYI